MVTDGYNTGSQPRRISTIEEQAEEGEVPEVTEGVDPLDDVDLTLPDDATFAAIYEDQKDDPIGASPQEEKDFPEGQ